MTHLFQTLLQFRSIAKLPAAVGIFVGSPVLFDLLVHIYLFVYLPPELQVFLDGVFAELGGQVGLQFLVGEKKFDEEVGIGLILVSEMKKHFCVIFLSPNLDDFVGEVAFVLLQGFHCDIVIPIVLTKMTHNQERFEGMVEVQGTNKAIFCLQLHVNVCRSDVLVPVLIVRIIEDSQNN